MSYKLSGAIFRNLCVRLRF